MDSAKLEWYIKERAVSDLFAGTYTSRNDIKETLQLWNNRGNKEDATDYDNFILQFTFENSEDASLLQYLSVKIDGLKYTLNIAGQKGIIALPKYVALKGAANNGVSSENKDHYIEIELTFHAEGDNIRFKEDDLKSLYIEVVPK